MGSSFPISPVISKASGARQGPSARLRDVRPTGWLLLTIFLASATPLETAGPAPAGAEELRTVTLRVAADETYRARDDWETTIRSAVGTVSDIYAKRFKIRFVIREIIPWTLGEAGSVREIVSRLRAE